MMLSSTDRRETSDVWVLLLYAVMAIGLLAPMASNTLIAQAPDHPTHLGLVVQARMALDEGEFPIRVSPWQYSGWLYPVYQFYSPLPYTVAGLIYRWVTPENPLYAYKATYWGALVLAGFFTYATGRLLTRSRPAAVIAGVVYMSAPYLMVNIHARAAFTEAIAQGLLPVVIYCSLRAYLAPLRSSRLLLAGVSWALLALTHNITFVCGSFFAGLLFVGLALRRRGVAGGLWHVGAAYALGCVLAAFFLAPVFVASPELLIQRGLPLLMVTNVLTTLPVLLEPVSLPSGHSGTPHLNPAIGLPVLVAVAVGIYLLSQRQPLRDTMLPARRMVGLLIALFFLAVWMAWSPVDFWQYFHRLVNLPQFPYRFVTYAVWTGSLLTAYALDVLFRGELDGRHVALGVPLVLLAHGSFLPPFVASATSLEQVVKTPDIGWGASDYLFDIRGLPVADAIPVNEIARFCLRDGAAQRCHIAVGDQPRVVQLPALFYRDLLDVKVDGQSVEYLLTAGPSTPRAVTGLIGVSLTPGFHAVEVRFLGLRWANRVSAVAWLAVLTALLVGQARRLGYARRPGIAVQTTPA